MKTIQDLQKLLRQESKIIKEIKQGLNELADYYDKCAQDDTLAEELKNDVNDQINTDNVNANAPDEEVQGPKDVETQEGEVDLKAVAEELTEQTPTSL